MEKFFEQIIFRSSHQKQSVKNYLQEISQNSLYYKAQVFSCEIHKICFKNAYFEEHLATTASELQRQLLR